MWGKARTAAHYTQPGATYTQHQLHTNTHTVDASPPPYTQPQPRTHRAFGLRGGCARDAPAGRRGRREGRPDPGAARPALGRHTLGFHARPGLFWEVRLVGVGVGLARAAGESGGNRTHKPPLCSTTRSLARLAPGGRRELGQVPGQVHRSTNCRVLARSARVGRVEGSDERPAVCRQLEAWTICPQQQALPAAATIRGPVYRSTTRSGDFSFRHRLELASGLMRVAFACRPGARPAPLRAHG